MKLYDIASRIANRLGVSMKRHKATAGAAIVAGAMMFAGPASGQLFSENFDDLALGPFISDSETGGDGTDWTDVPPTGLDPRQRRQHRLMAPPNSSDLPSLIRMPGSKRPENQSRRATFELGSGNVMVSDPDEYDDLGDIGDDLYNVFMMTPAISLDGVDAGTVAVNFDSSFRPYDTMTGLVDVSYDGGATWTNLLTLDPTTTPGGSSSLERANEAVSLMADNPAGGSMYVRFGMTDAGNDWWWAVDNVSVDVVPEPVGSTLMGVGAAAAAAFVRRRRRDSK